MTRPLRAVAWLVAVVVVLAAGWGMWSRRGVSLLSPRALSPAGADRDHLATAHVTVTLRVNFFPHADVLPGTPLILDVVLSTTSDADVAIGDSSRPWPSRLHFVRVGSSDPLPWLPNPLTAPIVSTISAPAGPDLPLTMQAGATATLRRKQTARASWAVAPEAVTVVLAGTYQIRTELDLPARGGRIESQPVTVVVLPSDKDDASGERGYVRLKLAALFDLAARRPEDAERAAEALVAGHPGSVDACLVLGDALAALGRESDAMVAYRRALSLARPAYEPPAAIYERMAQLSKRGG